MRCKEVSLFVVHPFYGYGDAGNEALGTLLMPRHRGESYAHVTTGIPPTATLHYTIQLLGFDIPMSPFQCVTFDDSFPEAFRRKEEGNTFFKKKLYDLATAKYTKAQLFLECAERERCTEEQQRQMEQVKLHCSLNLAFVTLRNREFEKTLIHCKGALDIDPTNMKALYRRGLVYPSLPMSCQCPHFTRRALLNPAFLSDMFIRISGQRPVRILIRFSRGNRITRTLFVPLPFWRLESAIRTSETLECINECSIKWPRRTKPARRSHRYPQVFAQRPTHTK